MQYLLTEEEYKALALKPREEAKEQLAKCRKKFTEALAESFRTAGVPRYDSYYENPRVSFLRWLKDFLEPALTALQMPPLPGVPEGKNDPDSKYDTFNP